MGVPYTHGKWKVKQGRETDFIQMWTEFAQFASNRGATGIRLLQDSETPADFYSFGSWTEAGQIAAFRNDPEFQRHIDGMQEMVESFEPIQCESRLEIGQMG